MPEILLAVDTSEILPGKLAEARAAIGDLVEFVRENEPRPLAYHVYFDEAGTRMTVVQIHPDAASMELHLSIAGAAFARFLPLLRIVAVDVYGEPSARLLELLERKAKMLGGARVTVHRLGAGVTRTLPRRSS